MLNNMKKKWLALLGMVLMGTSCTAVKEYDKMYINDPDMALSSKGIERYELNAHSYRESAVGANGGKTGGGCGCN